MNLVRFAHNWNNGILEYWNNGVRGMKGFKNGHAHGVIQLFFPSFQIYAAENQYQKVDNYKRL
jgi:hypothetical protein